jgi:TonB family protein
MRNRIPLGRTTRTAVAAVAALVLCGPAHAQDMLPGAQRGSDPMKQTQPVDADTLESAGLEDRAFLSADELPEPVRRVAPDSAIAMQPGRAQATVVVAVKVRRDGSAEEPRVLRSVPGLDRAAIDAVRSWTWKPGRLNGKPVDLEVAVPVRFVSWPDPSTDWTAERRLALTLEQDQRAVEAFDRFVVAVRALPAKAPRDTLDMLRRDVLRVRSQLPKEPGGPPGPDVVPIEAWVHQSQGDSAVAHARSVDDWRNAIAAYERALRWAPWQWPIYSRLAEAEWRTGERDAATAHLELYLLGDLPAAERAKAKERLTRLRAASGAADPAKR